MSEPQCTTCHLHDEGPCPERMATAIVNPSAPNMAALTKADKDEYLNIQFEDPSYYTEVIRTALKERIYPDGW